MHKNKIAPKNADDVFDTIFFLPSFRTLCVNSKIGYFHPRIGSRVSDVCDFSLQVDKLSAVFPAGKTNWQNHDLKRRLQIEHIL